jgi:alpha-glucuronidase
MKSGRTLWDELVFSYSRGAEEARALETRWMTLQGRVDEARYQAVLAKLRRQTEDAARWRDKCLRYFQAFSKGPLPGADGPR